MVSLWSPWRKDAAQELATDAFDDQALGLRNNRIKFASELNGVTAKNTLPRLTKGFGIALNNGDKGGDLRDYKTGNPNNDYKLYIPVNKSVFPTATMLKGWSLVTAAASKSLTGGNGDKIAMVMDLNGTESKVWVDTATTGNSLTAVVEGETYFVYFKGKKPGFTFFK